MESQQAHLPQTTDLNTEMIAEANRLISASRPPRGEEAGADAER